MSVSDNAETPNFAVGDELRAEPRAMTRERMRWYVETQATVAADDGKHHTQEPTIHDDDEYARSQGLPGIISDGMVSTNWIMGLMLDAFGRDFVRNGRLRTKYIAPIFEDQIVISIARVTSVERTSDTAVTYNFEVWCEDDTQKKLTVGEATVRLGIN